MLILVRSVHAGYVFPSRDVSVLRLQRRGKFLSVTTEACLRGLPQRVRYRSEKRKLRPAKDIWTASDNDTKFLFNLMSKPEPIVSQRSCNCTAFIETGCASMTDSMPTPSTKDCADIFNACSSALRVIGKHLFHLIGYYLTSTQILRLRPQASTEVVLNFCCARRLAIALKA
jgi:hypothetical protein